MHWHSLQRLLSGRGLAEHLLGYLPLRSLLAVGLACRELRSLINSLPEALLARAAAAEFPAGHPARSNRPVLPYLRAQQQLRTALAAGGQHTRHPLPCRVDAADVAPICRCIARLSGNRLHICMLPSGNLWRTLSMPFAVSSTKILCPISWAHDSTVLVLAEGCHFKELNSEPSQAKLVFVNAVLGTCTQASVLVDLQGRGLQILGWSSPAAGLLAIQHLDADSETAAVSVFSKVGELVASRPFEGLTSPRCSWTPSGATLCLAEDTIAHLWHLDAHSLQRLKVPGFKPGLSDGTFWSPCQQLLLLTHWLPLGAGLQLNTYGWQQPEADPTAVQLLPDDNKCVLAWGLCGLLVTPLHPLEETFTQLLVYRQERAQFVLAHTVSLGGLSFISEMCRGSAQFDYALLPDSSVLVIPVFILMKVLTALCQLSGQQLRTQGLGCCSAHQTCMASGCLLQHQMLLVGDPCEWGREGQIGQSLLEFG